MNSGPGRKRASPTRGSRIEVPMMSLGIRSGVNCTRPKRTSTAAASVCTRRVFATPGTPSMRLWPEQRSVTKARRTADSCPTTTPPTAARSAP